MKAERNLAIYSRFKVLAVLFCDDPKHRLRFLFGGQQDNEPTGLTLRAVTTVNTHRDMNFRCFFLSSIARDITGFVFSCKSSLLDRVNNLMDGFLCF